ncbi:hypothetical protein F2P79_021847 [Pimephales promelas]|nr:hypothetical protein F2P79_021847 [Pimephales promelas]
MEGIFNVSLKLGVVPQLWKTSCVVPVPKASHPKDLNSYRPVTLKPLSHSALIPGNCCKIAGKLPERLLCERKHVPGLIPSSKPGWGLPYFPPKERTIVCKLERSRDQELLSIRAEAEIVHHLCGTGLYITPDEDAGETQFTYRPSIGVEDAVIFLQHHALAHLEKPGSIVRIMFFDFSNTFNTTQPMLLKDKLERTGLDHLLSQWVLNYLTDRPQLKFSDDSAIVGLITNDDGKTKEMVVCRRRPALPPPVNIQGMDIERVDTFKYMGVHLTNKLDWTHNTEALYKRGQSRLYFLGRLRSFE